MSLTLLFNRPVGLSISAAGGIGSGEAVGGAAVSVLSQAGGGWAARPALRILWPLSRPTPTRIEQAGGIASAEAVGGARIRLSLRTAGTSSREAMGRAELRIGIRGGGIASQETVAGWQRPLWARIGEGCGSESIVGQAQVQLRLGAGGIEQFQRVGGLDEIWQDPIEVERCREDRWLCGEEWNEHEDAVERELLIC